jgi:hypothetical protein
MKSLNVREIETLAKKVFPIGETDNVALMTFIANLLWINLSEKEQNKIIVRLNKKAENK